MSPCISGPPWICILSSYVWPSSVLSRPRHRQRSTCDVPIRAWWWSDVAPRIGTPTQRSSKLCRMLEEGMGFGTAFVCYSGTAKPLVADGLRMAAHLGDRRLIVLPFLLFDGVLVKRIYEAAAGLAARHPDLEVLTSHYMGVHPDMADVFLERAQEGVEGRAHMNCSLCKYRVQIVGFELTGRRTAAATPCACDQFSRTDIKRPYVTPPLEAENFRVIDTGRDWSGLAEAEKHVAQRLVQSTGDVAIVDDLFFAPGAVEAGYAPS